MENEIIKALKQRIDELENENSKLRNKVSDLEMDKNGLMDRILDMEACE